MLSDTDKEILNCMVEAWDENARLPGGISYIMVFELCDRLGLQRPSQMQAWIESVDKKPFPPVGQIKLEAP